MIFNILKSKSSIGLQISNDLIIILITFIPSIVAIIFTYFIMGGKAVGTLLKRVIQYKFHKVWYLYIFLLMPSILILSYLILNIFTVVEFNSILLPVIINQPWSIILIFLYMLALQGPLGEELGWRGFALDKLLQLFTPIKSSLILGVIWSLWHLPMFFMKGTIQYEIAANGFIAGFIGYLVYTVMVTILLTILHLKTNGSILAAVLFHTMSNFSHGLITILTNVNGGLVILVVMFFVTLVLIRVNKKYICQLQLVNESN